jgi:hypothetical protein
MRATYPRVSGNGGTHPHAATGAGPALYAASASDTSANCRSRSRMRCAWASMAWAASNGSSSPMAAAVPGMNCAMPCAPALLTAKGLNPDSAYNCAARRVADTFQRCAARDSIGANRSGTNPGTPAPRSPSAVDGVDRAFSA